MANCSFPVSPSPGKGGIFAVLAEFGVSLDMFGENGFTPWTNFSPSCVEFYNPCLRFQTNFNASRIPETAP